MSISADKQGKSIFYLNFTKYGDNTNPQCTVAENYSIPVIQSSSKWMIGVDRFSVPLHDIPVVEETVLTGAGAGNNVISGCAVRLVQGNNPNTYAWVGIRACHCIADLFNQLNQISAATLGFFLTDSGRARVAWTDYQNDDRHYIQLSQELSDILDLATNTDHAHAAGAIGGVGSVPVWGGRGSLNNAGNLDGAEAFVGGHSIFDRVDQLRGVRITCIGLPVKSEILPSNTYGKIISDFMLNNSYNMSWSGSALNMNDDGFNCQDPPRQNLVFHSQGNPRWIQLSNQDLPVRNISITVHAVLHDGSTKIIRLPPRSEFSIKIMFVSKSV